MLVKVNNYLLEVKSRKVESYKLNYAWGQPFKRASIHCSRRRTLRKCPINNRRALLETDKAGASDDGGVVVSGVLTDPESGREEVASVPLV